MHQMDPLNWIHSQGKYRTENKPSCQIMLIDIGFSSPNNAFPP